MCTTVKNCASTRMAVLGKNYLRVPNLQNSTSRKTLVMCREMKGVNPFDGANFDGELKSPFHKSTAEMGVGRGGGVCKIL